MTPADFEKHLAVLSHEDTHYLQQNWEASARWMFEQAVAGADIAAALPALVAIYIEATQIGVLRAAAAAAAAHDLRTGDVGRLREMLRKSKYRDWVFEGIGDAVGKGRDLAPAVPLLLEFSGARQYLVVQLLLRHAGKGGLAGTARKIARHAPGMLAEFLKEAQSKKFPIEPALPELAAQLADRKRARNVASEFRWMVELGADLSGVLGALEAHLDAKDEDLAAEAGYCLAYHHAAKRDWPAVDALLAAKHPRAAWAAARALRVRLLGGGDDVPEVVDRVAAGLLSADRDTAARSLVTLREAKEKGRRCAPSPELASRLAASPDSGVAEYLHLALPAAEILALEPGSAPAAARLRAACERPVAACSICARLPRSGNWNYESELPAGYDKLDGRGGSAKCPECGRRYGRYYEDEWEDMSHSETWSLERWTPPEALAQLKAAALQEYKASLDGWIARFREELRHPAQAVREEAAYDLAAHFAATGQWEELSALVSPGEDTVRLRALDSLRKRPEDPTPLLGTLHGLLTAGHHAVRSRAADILATRAVRLNDVAALRVLLDSADAQVLAASAEAVFQGTHNAFDAAPLFDRLAELRKRAESSVSAPARRTLTVLAEKPGPPDALPLLVEDLSSPVADVRSSAAFAITRIVPSRPDAVAALPKFVELLRDSDSVSWAMDGLQALAAAGADILPAIPVIVACALDPKCHRREDMVYWLQRLAAGGADLRPHIAGIASLLAGTESMQSAAHQLLLEIFRKGADMSAAVEPLRAMLDDAPPYIREYAGELLANWHVQKRDVEGLRLLLRHARPEPPGVAAEVLRKSRFDVVPLLPDLVALIGHPKSWTRGKSVEALVAFAGSGPAAHEAVVAALKQGGPEAGTVLEKIERTTRGS